MEYRRINSHPSLPTLPSYTHTYTNSIPLDSWSISGDSTIPLGSLFVHSPCQGYTHNPTGLPAGSQGCAHTQNPNQGASHTLSPPFRVLCFYATYLTRDSTTQHVCSPGVGFNPPEFLLPCGLPVSCYLATSVVQSRNSGARQAQRL